MVVKTIRNVVLVVEVNHRKYGGGGGGETIVI